MDNLVDNLTAEELSRPEEGELQTQSLKRSRYNDIREIPASDEEEEYEEGELQSHLPKKAKIEGIPAYLDSIPEPTIPERLARMGSNSLPAPTKYIACTFLPAELEKSDHFITT